MTRDDLIDERILPGACLRHANGQDLEISLEELESLVELRIAGIRQLGCTAQVDRVQRPLLEQCFIDLLRGLRQASFFIGKQVIFLRGTVIFREIIVAFLRKILA